MNVYFSTQKDQTILNEKLLKNSALRFIPRPQIYDPEFLTQLTLDASSVLVKEQFDIDTWGLLALQTREHIHKIHHRRLAVARFTERLTTYLCPKTYLKTHLRPKTCLILKICIKTCHKSILVVN